MRPAPFTRPTIIAATEMLERHTQAKFDTMALRLALKDQIPEDAGLSVAKKCGLVARAVIARPDLVVHTLDGSVTLTEALVREAVALVRPRFASPAQTALLRGLARDGYVVEEDEDTHTIRLRAALPEEIALPETNDEVRRLLRQLGFQVPAGHLDKAIEAYIRRRCFIADTPSHSNNEVLQRPVQPTPRVCHSSLDMSRPAAPCSAARLRL